MAVRYIGFCLFVLWSLFIIKLKIFYLNDVNILIMDCVTSYILIFIYFCYYLMYDYF